MKELFQVLISEYCFLFHRNENSFCTCSES
jgi:hypothetical protein